MPPNKASDQAFSKGMQSTSADRQAILMTAASFVLLRSGSGYLDVSSPLSRMLLLWCEPEATGVRVIHTLALRDGHCDADLLTNRVPGIGKKRPMMGLLAVRGSIRLIGKGDVHITCSK